MSQENEHRVLRNHIENKTIQVVVREVSKDRLSRTIDFLVVDGEKLQTISFLIADVLGLKQSKKHFGLIVRGVGMDMVFSCLYELFDKIGLNTSNIKYSLI